MRTAFLASGLVIVLGMTGIADAKKRADAGSFVIRYRDPRATDLDHPALVEARRALWDCWQSSRPCAVSLSWEYRLDSFRHQDALLDVSTKGVRSILLRTSGSGATVLAPRRYTRLERIPLVRGDWGAAALPDSDRSGPDHWRLRFAGGDFVRGAGGEASGPRDAVEVW